LPLTHSEVFASIQQQLGKKFKYSDVDPDIKSYSLKNALSLLIKAGVAYPCFHSTAQGDVYQSVKALWVYRLAGPFPIFFN
jgi:hypothetical protein